MSNKIIVLITGSNSGIGKATAAAIIQASSKYHVITTSRSADKGKEALNELESLKAPGSVSYQQLEVTNEASIDRAVTAVDKEFGRLDVLINNAGCNNSTSPFRDYVRESLTINAIGPALVAEAFKPLLKKSADPRSIYISSLMGYIPFRLNKEAPQPPEMVAYRMSKAALNMAVACAFRDDGDWLKVWAVCPGLVVTNLGRGPDLLKKMGGSDVSVPAKTLLDIVKGKRDADVGKFVHKDGVYPWTS